MIEKLKNLAIKKLTLYIKRDLALTSSEAYVLYTGLSKKIKSFVIYNQYQMIKIKRFQIDFKDLDIE